MFSVPAPVLSGSKEKGRESREDRGLAPLCSGPSPSRESGTFWKNGEAKRRNNTRGTSTCGESNISVLFSASSSSSSCYRGENEDRGEEKVKDTVESFQVPCWPQSMVRAGDREEGGEPSPFPPPPDCSASSPSTLSYSLTPTSSACISPHDRTAFGEPRESGRRGGWRNLCSESWPSLSLPPASVDNKRTPRSSKFAGVTDRRRENGGEEAETFHIAPSNDHAHTDRVVRQEFRRGRDGSLNDSDVRGGGESFSNSLSFSSSSSSSVYLHASNKVCRRSVPLPFSPLDPVPETSSPSSPGEGEVAVSTTDGEQRGRPRVEEPLTVLTNEDMEVCSKWLRLRHSTRKEIEESQRKRWSERFFRERTPRGPFHSHSSYQSPCSIPKTIRRPMQSLMERGPLGRTDSGTILGAPKSENPRFSAPPRSQIPGLGGTRKRLPGSVLATRVGGRGSHASSLSTSSLLLRAKKEEKALRGVLSSQSGRSLGDLSVEEGDGVCGQEETREGRREAPLEHLGVGKGRGGGRAAEGRGSAEGVQRPKRVDHSVKKTKDKPPPRPSLHQPLFIQRLQQQRSQWQQTEEAAPFSLSVPRRTSASPRQSASNRLQKRERSLENRSCAENSLLGPANQRRSGSSVRTQRAEENEKGREEEAQARCSGTHMDSSMYGEEGEGSKRVEIEAKSWCSQSVEDVAPAASHRDMESATKLRDAALSISSEETLRRQAWLLSLSAHLNEEEEEEEEAEHCGDRSRSVSFRCTPEDRAMCSSSSLYLPTKGSRGAVEKETERRPEGVHLSSVGLSGTRTRKTLRGGRKRQTVSLSTDLRGRAGRSGGEMTQEEESGCLPASSGLREDGEGEGGEGKNTLFQQHCEGTKASGPGSVRPAVNEADSTQTHTASTKCRNSKRQPAHQRGQRKALIDRKEEKQSRPNDIPIRSPSKEREQQNLIRKEKCTQNRKEDQNKEEQEEENRTLPNTFAVPLPPFSSVLSSSRHLPLPSSFSPPLRSPTPSILNSKGKSDLPAEESLKDPCPSPSPFVGLKRGKGKPTTLPSRSSLNPLLLRPNPPSDLSPPPPPISISPVLQNRAGVLFGSSRFFSNSLTGGQRPADQKRKGCKQPGQSPLSFREALLRGVRGTCVGETTGDLGAKLASPLSLSRLDRERDRGQTAGLSLSPPAFLKFKKEGGRDQTVGPRNESMGPGVPSLASVGPGGSAMLSADLSDRRVCRTSDQRRASSFSARQQPPSSSPLSRAAQREGRPFSVVSGTDSEERGNASNRKLPLSVSFCSEVKEDTRQTDAFEALSKAAAAEASAGTVELLGLNRAKSRGSSPSRSPQKLFLSGQGKEREDSSARPFAKNLLTSKVSSFSASKSPKGPDLKSREERGMGPKRAGMCPGMPNPPPSLCPDPLRARVLSRRVEDVLKEDKDCEGGDVQVSDCTDSVREVRDGAMDQCTEIGVSGPDSRGVVKETREEEKKKTETEKLERQIRDVCRKDCSPVVPMLHETFSSQNVKRKSLSPSKPDPPLSPSHPAFSRRQSLAPSTPFQHLDALAYPIAVSGNKENKMEAQKGQSGGQPRSPEPPLSILSPPLRQHERLLKLLSGSEPLQRRLRVQEEFEPGSPLGALRNLGGSPLNSPLFPGVESLSSPALSPIPEDLCIEEEGPLETHEKKIERVGATGPPCSMPLAVQWRTQKVPAEKQKKQEGLGKGRQAQTEIRSEKGKDGQRNRSQISSSFHLRGDVRPSGLVTGEKGKEGILVRSEGRKEGEKTAQLAAPRKNQQQQQHPMQTDLNGRGGALGRERRPRGAPKGRNAVGSTGGPREKEKEKGSVQVNNNIEQETEGRQAKGKRGGRFLAERRREKEKGKQTQAQSRLLVPVGFEIPETNSNSRISLSSLCLTGENSFSSLLTTKVQTHKETEGQKEEERQAHGLPPSLSCTFADSSFASSLSLYPAEGGKANEREKASFFMPPVTTPEKSMHVSASSSQPVNLMMPSFAPSSFPPASPSNGLNDRIKPTLPPTPNFPSPSPDGSAFFPQRGPLDDLSAFDAFRPTVTSMSWMSGRDVGAKVSNEDLLQPSWNEVSRKQASVPDLLKGGLIDGKLLSQGPGMPFASLSGAAREDPHECGPRKQVCADKSQPSATLSFNARPSPSQSTVPVISLERSPCLSEQKHGLGSGLAHSLSLSSVQQYAAAPIFNHSNSHQAQIQAHHRIGDTEGRQGPFWQGSSVRMSAVPAAQVPRPLSVPERGFETVGSRLLPWN